MVLYLIRHGKTAANEAHLYCGSTDLPLSQNGADELRQLHYEIPEDCVFYTSGMRRTEQTLELLFGNIPHHIDPRLREVDFGSFEMHSYEQLRTDPAYQQWLTGDNEANLPPCGESGNQMRQRVLEALEQLLEKKQNAVIIAHGGTVAMMMQQLFPEEGNSRYAWQPNPGCGYRIEGNSYRPIPQTTPAS